MKIALSLAAALVLGCATAALAQPNQYGPQYGNGYDQGYDRPGAYDQNDPGYDNNQPYRNGPDTNYNGPGAGTSAGAQWTFVPIDRHSVQMIQMSLQGSGFDPGPANGRWDRQTASALAGFQRAHRLDATGTLDFRTVQALREPDAYGGHDDTQPPDSYDNDYRDGGMNGGYPRH